MALPITISGVTFTTPQGGPFKSGSSFYIATVSSAGDVVVFKADSNDPSSGWTEQDSANKPTNGAISSLHGVLVGTTIHIATQTGSGASDGEVEYHTFDCSTDTWSITNESVTTTPDTATEFCSIAVRSDGDVIIAYAGEQEGVMGTGYDRVHLARREGGSWTVDIDVTNAGKAATHYRQPFVVMSANDRAHIFYYEPGGGDGYYSTYLNGNTWGHQNSQFSTDVLAGNSIKATSFDVTGTNKIRVATQNAANSAVNIHGFNDADSPGTSISIATDVTGAEPSNNSFGFAVDDATDTQYLLSGDSSNNINEYETGSGNDTWSANLNELTGLTSPHPVFSANVYDNSGTVLAYLYQSGSNYRYNERSLGAGGDNLTATGIASGTPAVGSPAISQVHALAANDTDAGTPATGNPLLSQAHVLTADGVVSGTPATGNPTLSLVHNLAADGTTAGQPSTGTPDLTQSHALTANDTTAGDPSTGVPSLAQVHNLSADDTAAGAPTTGTPALSQHHVLTADSVATGSPSTGTPSISESNVLSADGIASGAPTVGNPQLTQAHVLSADSVAAAAPSTGTPDIAQLHALSANDTDAGSPSVGTPTLTENSGTDALDAVGIAAGTPSVGNPTITQVHDLAAQGVASGIPTTGTPGLTQSHVLDAVSVASGAPSTGNPSLQEVHSLTAESVSAGTPTVGTPDISQAHVLTAVDVIAGAPVVGLPSLNQQHVLSANDTVAGNPSTGLPTLTEAGPGHDALAANSIASGAPTCGAPVLSEIVVAAGRRMGGAIYVRHEQSVWRAIESEAELLPLRVTVKPLRLATIKRLQPRQPEPPKPLHINRQWSTIESQAALMQVKVDVDMTIALAKRKKAALLALDLSWQDNCDTICKRLLQLNLQE